MNISPAVLQDASGIAGVHVRSWQAAYAGILSSEFLDGLSVEARAAQWQDILSRQASQTLVARRTDGIVGFVSLGGWREDPGAADHGEIWALYATPEVWGTGVGWALLDAAVRELRALGRRSVSVWVLGKNERAVRFYEAFGFRPVPGSPKLIDLGGRRVEEVCLRLAPDT